MPLLAGVRFLGAIPYLETFPGFGVQDIRASKKLRAPSRGLQVRVLMCWCLDGSFPKEGDPNIDPNIL